MSQAVEDLEEPDQGTRTLDLFDIDYVYIGARGDFAGVGLDAQRLVDSGGFKLVYQNSSVAILEVQH